MSQPCSLLSKAVSRTKKAKLYARARVAMFCVCRTGANCNGYNFDNMLAPVKSYLENADITVAIWKPLWQEGGGGLGTYPSSVPLHRLLIAKNVG